MKVGITGSRDGMTYRQMSNLMTLLRSLAIDIDEFHHGDCIGVDEESAYWAWNEPYVTVIAHPSNDSRQRAFTEYDYVREPKPPLERNHDIVDETSLLIVVPKQRKEIMRSGTWATYRYALLMHKPRIVVYP